MRRFVEQENESKPFNIFERVTLPNVNSPTIVLEEADTVIRMKM